MNNEYEGAIDPIYLNMGNYEAENIDRTLEALKPFLLHRQIIARKHYLFNEDVKQLINHCNREILAILSIPKP